MQDFNELFLGIWKAYGGWILSFIKALFVLALGIYFAFFMRKKVKRVLSQKDPILAHFFAQIIFFSLILLSAIATLGTLGVQTNSFIAFLGTVGLAIALGLKNSLSNLASGILLAFLRPFKQDDYIQIGSTKGKVSSLNLFHTTLELKHQSQAIIPNETIAKATIINHSRNHQSSSSWTLKLVSQKTLHEINTILNHTFCSLNLEHPIPTYQLVSIQNQEFTFKIEIWAKDSQTKETILQDLLELLRANFSSLEIFLKD